MAKKRPKAVGGVRKVRGGWQAVWNGGSSGSTAFFASRETAEIVAKVETLRAALRWREWRDYPCGMTLDRKRKCFFPRPPRWAPAVARTVVLQLHERERAIRIAERWARDALREAQCEIPA